MTDYSSLFPYPRGDATAVDVAGGRLKTLAGNVGQLGQAFRAEGQGMGSAWQSSSASQAAQSQVTRLADASSGFTQKITAAGDAAQQYAARMRDARLAVQRIQLRAQECEREALNNANRPPNLTQPQRTEIFRSQLDAALQQLQQQYRQVITDLQSAGQQCAQAMQAAVPGYQPGMTAAQAAAAAQTSAASTLSLGHASQLAALGGRGEDGLTPPAPSNDPVKTRQWWAALDDSERQRIIQASHRDLGNLNGIPASARSQANELSVAEDLTSTNEDIRKNAEAVRDGLARARQQVDPITGQPAVGQLYVYQPGAFGGDGRAAISVGDLDTAQNVVFSVPGITNDVSKMTGNVDSAYNLYDEARKADRGASTAVVAWMGYDAPSGWDLAGTPFTGQAKEGAQLLADDVNGAQAMRTDQPHMTVIGHSYGSVTVGYAAANDGMRATDVVLLGSPGSTADDAAGLNRDPGHVWVGSASHDPVSWLGHFNTDPATTSFGANRFQAENPGYLQLNPIYDHVHYFDQNSESLYNMSQIVTGRYGSVISADQRHATLWGAGPVWDPEEFRHVTNPTNGN